jgi:putative restriction endonuclease
VTDTNIRQRELSLVWRSELQEAAAYHGYRGDAGEADGWLFFRNQEGVPGEIALAVGPQDSSGHDASPWFLAIDHPGVIEELDAPRAAGPPGQYKAAYAFENRAALRDAISRVFQLARSVPDFPLKTFEEDVAHLGDTEAEQLLRRRIGQDRFRSALLDYWGQRCPLSHVTEREMLRASHIIPWSQCVSDAQRLDVHNGLLLAAHWDAAFDAGLVSFSDDGSILMKSTISAGTRDVLGNPPKLEGLTDKHQQNLAWHRNHYGFNI